jgi:hypothetical protein
MNEDKTGPMDSVFRHLGGLLSQTDPGYVNTAPEFCEYLKRAGFLDIECRENLIPGSVGMVIGKKPK